MKFLRGLPLEEKFARADDAGFVVRTLLMYTHLSRLLQGGKMGVPVVIPRSTSDVALHKKQLLETIGKKSKSLGPSKLGALRLGASMNYAKRLLVWECAFAKLH